MDQRFPNAPFVSISQSQRTPAPNMNWLATIHHGLPLTLLPFTQRSEEYLAFLGRIDPEKGPDVAIRVAHAAGLPLRIAAKVPRGQTRYLKKTVKPLIEGNGAHFVGEVNDREKQNFLGKALALLFPVNWPGEVLNLLGIWRGASFACDSANGLGEPSKGATVWSCNDRSDGMWDMSSHGREDQSRR